MSSPVRRRLLATTTTVALALGVQAAATLPGAAVVPTALPEPDCAEAYPVADLAEGDPVDGLTVTQGTEPVGFTGEVIGVLEDAVAPGLDMVMAELDMSAFNRTGGVWQGMSGSPVYAADGRLIGAVAYGLSNGPSPVAGITPFAEMDDYLDGAPQERIALRGADARAVAAGADVSVAEAREGFTQLPMPMSMSGLSARRLAQAKAAEGPRRQFLDRSTVAASGTSADVEADASSLVAGGNMAVSASYGDVSLAGVGTVTSVCGERAVGFGHPMAFLGSTTMGLHPAEALYVQPESLGAPFKVANIGPAVGTVTDDRLTGVTGSFGDALRAATVSSDVTYGDRARVGTTETYVGDFVADVTLYQMLANTDRVVDGPVDGTSLLRWSITGTANGAPFTLARTDRWTGRDLGFETAYDTGFLAFVLSRMDGVELTGVETEADVTDDSRRHTVSAVEQYRNGRWVAVTRAKPAVGTAGKPVRLRVVLGGSAGRRVVTMAPIEVPKRARGRIDLVVQGGDGMYYWPEGSTVGAVRKSLATQLRHDQVRIQLGTPDKLDIGFGGDEFFERGGPGRRGVSFVRTRTPDPLDHVVSGTRMLRLTLR